MSSIKTPENIARIGQMLFATHWQSDMANALGVSDRTVRRWAKGAIEMPSGAWFDIGNIADQRRIDLLTFIDQINEEEKVAKYSIRQPEVSPTSGYQPDTYSAETFAQVKRELARDGSPWHYGTGFHVLDADDNIVFTKNDWDDANAECERDDTTLTLRMLKWHRRERLEEASDA